MSSLTLWPYYGPLTRPKWNSLMSGGRQTKVRQRGVLDNVLTFLWDSQLCGFEGQRGVFMWNHVSTHYELSFPSLHCHWPVNGTSRPELSWNKGEEWKKCRLSVRRTQRATPSASLQQNRMNREKWDIVRFLRLRDDNMSGLLVGFFSPLCLLHLLCDAIQSRHWAQSQHQSQPVSHSGGFWLDKNVWHRPRPDTRNMADEVIQSPDRDALWVKCALFRRGGGGQLWKHKCRTAGKQRSNHSVKLDADLNKYSRFQGSCPNATPLRIVFNSCIETCLNTQRSHMAH